MLSLPTIISRAALAAISRTPVLAGIAMRAAPDPDWGWYKGAERELTPYRYHADHRAHLIRPVDAVVLHYTASPWSARGDWGEDMPRMRRWARGEGRQSSTHFVVLRDGRILQLMPLSDRAWHITNSRRVRDGRRIHHRHPIDGKTGINGRTIAIDFENVGFLTRPSGTGPYFNDYGGQHFGRAVTIDGRPWEKYTEPQIESAGRLLAALGERFPILCDGRRERLFSHSDVQDTRSDPGPACPVDWLYRALMGDEGVS